VPITAFYAVALEVLHLSHVVTYTMIINTAANASPQKH